MSELNTYRILCMSEAMSPITHMMGTSGNESLINREPVMTQSGVVQVPVLSGNALRHRVIRDPGAKYLIGLYNLAGKLNIDQLNFLLSGGSLTESSVSDNMRTIADMQRLFPLYRLLGGSLRNQIIAGSLQVGRGLLVCEENRETINKSLLPEFAKLENQLLHAEVFVSQYQYTRGDVKRMKDVDFFAAVDELNDPDSASTLMIYTGQSVMRNAVFVHEITALNVSYNEIGALFDALSRWQAKGGSVGGNTRIGHGKLKTSVYAYPEVDIADAVSQYQEYARSVKEEAIDWLNNAFPVKAKKEKVK